MDLIAARAVLSAERQTACFQRYTEVVLGNAKALEGGLFPTGAALGVGGTSSHYCFLVSLSWNTCGRQLGAVPAGGWRYAEALE